MDRYNIKSGKIGKPYWVGGREVVHHFNQSAHRYLSGVGARVYELTENHNWMMERIEEMQQEINGLHAQLSQPPHPE